MYFNHLAALALPTHAEVLMKLVDLHRRRLETDKAMKAEGSD